MSDEGVHSCLMLSHLGWEKKQFILSDLSLYQKPPVSAYRRLSFGAMTF
jgi:hypothetical protein